MCLVLIIQKDRYIINNGKLAILKEYKSQDQDGKLTVDTINYYNIEEIPEGVEPNKYCYTPEQGFFKNTNYKEYYSEEERLSAIEDIMNILLLGGNE